MNTLKCYRFRIIEFASVVRLVDALNILFLLACMTMPAAAYAAQRERLVVLPFEIVDNTPVPGGDDRNAIMLDKLTDFIAQSIKQEGAFDVVAQSEVNEAVSAARLGTYLRTCNQCEYDLAEKLEGDKVMTGWIYKMSILILTMHIEVKDVSSRETLISKAYDFRGDNEKAWVRASKYMLRDLARILHPAAANGTQGPQGFE